MSQVLICDDMMGRGKSSAAINYINNSSEDERFLVITPFLEEVKRYKEACRSKHLKEPTWKKGSKFETLKDMIRRGENIVSTHALFQKFDNELIEICNALNYTLIMDEVANVVDTYPLPSKDQETLLEKYCDVEEGTNLLIWKENAMDYDGKKFESEQMLCNLKSLAYYNGNIMIWLFPIGVFRAFRKIYILTYMFNAQLQRYYYDYYHVEYSYIHVKGNSVDTYEFTDEPVEYKYLYDYKSLIHVCQHEKLNSIGETPHSLSSSWYKAVSKTIIMKQLKNHIYNFFFNITKTGYKQNLWTTFKDYRHTLTGKGYSKSFLALNARATNDYKDTISVAYVVNRYINPVVKNFFITNGVSVDEDGFALSEMIQFIWRSAIRDGKEITLYVPSSRMRNLLLDWLEEISK